MNQGFRGGGDVEDVEEDIPPQYGRVVGDDDDDDFQVVSEAELNELKAKGLWTLS